MEKSGMPVCVRCREYARISTVSWFNTDVICKTCSEIEEKHPLFQRAKDTERKEVEKGNLNYPGLFYNRTWEEIKRMKEHNR